jgi:two-component system NtrC family sensor kinase
MNATDAIEENGKEGQGKIDIICENVIVEEEKSVQVRIIDNGPGVNGSHIDNIFDPFFTTKETGKGTGLGLYVSYTIMESLGGNIRFNNLQPAGAEVEIQLPCISVDL